METTRAGWRIGGAGRSQFGVVIFEEDAVSAPTLQHLLEPIGIDVQTARMGFPRPDEDDSAFADRLRAAAGTILPSTAPRIMGFACTTGAIQLGPDRLREALTRPGAVTEPVTPVAALTAALGRLGVGRLAIVSPYSSAVSARVAAHIESFGFTVSRLSCFDAGNGDISSISGDSIFSAAKDCCVLDRPDAIYLSCTGLRATPLIAALEADLGIAVLTSLQVMAWHAAVLLGFTPRGPGQLFASA